MRQRTYLAVVLIGLVAVGCGKDKASGGPMDSDRPLLKSRGGFTGENSKLGDLKASDLYDLHLCGDRSTADRLFETKYEVRTQYLSRNKVAPDSPALLTHDEFLYSTESGGKVYKLGHTRHRYELGGNNALYAGPYTYEKTCTQGSACGDDLAIYLLQDAWYVARTENRMRQLMEDTNYDIPLNCEFREKDIDKDISYQVGTFNTAEAAYPAVIYRASLTGEVYCEGVKIGEGKKVIEQIVAKDLLPESVGEATYTNSEGKTCNRTILFSGETIEVGTNLIEGTSVEMLSYKLTGEFR